MFEENRTQKRKDWQNFKEPNENISTSKRHRVNSNSKFQAFGAAGLETKIEFKPDSYIRHYGISGGGTDRWDRQGLAHPLEYRIIFLIQYNINTILIYNLL